LEIDGGSDGVPDVRLDIYVALVGVANLDSGFERRRFAIRIEGGELGDGVMVAAKIARAEADWLESPVVAEEHRVKVTRQDAR
jgi:hypothetical protein